MKLSVQSGSPTRGVGVAMRKAMWLFHPDAPGDRVLVVRGWLGRLIKPREFATLGEAIDHSLRQAAQRGREE